MHAYIFVLNYQPDICRTGAPQTPACQHPHLPSPTEGTLAAIVQRAPACTGTGPMLIPGSNGRIGCTGGKIPLCGHEPFQLQSCGPFSTGSTCPGPV